MICTSCKNETDDGSLFCNKCGEKLPVNLLNNEDCNVTNSTNDNITEENIIENNVSEANVIKDNTIKSSYDEVNNAQENTINNYNTMGMATHLSNKPNKNRKKTLTITIPIALVVIGIFIFMSLNNPVNKFIKCIDSQDFITAEEIYTTKIMSKPHNVLEANEKLTKKVNTIKNNYINEDISYESAFTFLDNINNMDYLDANFSSILILIKDINESRNSYKEAETALANNDYLNAYSKYKEVIKADKNYDSAQSKMSDNKSNYIDSLFKDCDSKMDDKKYEDVVKLLDNASNEFKDDSSIVDKISTFKSKKMDIIKDNQLISVEKAHLTEQHAEFKSLYPDMMQAIVKNNSDKKATEINICFLGFDKDGNSIKIKDSKTTNRSYETTGVAENINLASGESYGSDVGFELSVGHGIVNVKACVQSATFSDGSKWVNPYLQTWILENKKV